MVEDWQSVEIGMIVSTSVAEFAAMARCGGRSIKHELVIGMEAEPHGHQTVALLLSSPPLSLLQSQSQLFHLTANEFLLLDSGRLESRQRDVDGSKMSVSRGMRGLTRVASEESTPTFSHLW